MTRRFGLCLIALMMVGFSCSTMRRSDASAFFRDKYPTYELLSSETGEGWDGVVNYHFNYRKPDDEKVYEEACTFIREDNGSWRSSGCWEPK